jgi:hypothetical protein
MIDGCSCRSQFQAMQLALFLFGQRFHIEVTMGLKPTFVDLNRQGATFAVKLPLLVSEAANESISN